jgi:hypothetical protein
MTAYSVNWKIDIEAESPVEAAKQALEIQRDPATLATVFEIYDEDGNHTSVDLLEIRENRTGRFAGDQSDSIETHKPALTRIPHWEDDAEFPSEDWKSEVANGDTRLGYREWVERQRAEQHPQTVQRP